MDKKRFLGRKLIANKHLREKQYSPHLGGLIYPNGFLGSPINRIHVLLLLNFAWSLLEWNVLCFQFPLLFSIFLLKWLMYRAIYVSSQWHQDKKNLTLQLGNSGRAGKADLLSAPRMLYNQIALCFSALAAGIGLTGSLSHNPSF